MPKLLVKSALQILFRIQRVQRWWAALETYLDGAPADERKIWKLFRHDTVPAFRNVIRLRMKKIAHARANLALCTYEPVIPHKKFLIAIPSVSKSKEAAERCIRSAKQHGEDHNLEIMPAITRFQARNFFIQHDLTWASGLSCEYRNRLAQMGCFSSHFKLWLRCMELGKPIVILEHDAVFKTPIPPLRFKHVIMLGTPQPTTIKNSPLYCDMVDTFEEGENYYPSSFLLGAHAYAIKPEGARKLVEAARKEPLLPVDCFIRKKYVDILAYEPYPTYLDERFTSISSFRKDIPPHETFWKDYKPPAS